MRSKQFRAAIIGCGGRGRGHAGGYAQSKDVALVACADPMIENAKKLATERNIPKVYTDPQEMLDKEKPDIVSVCVWTGLHLPLIRAAVESGAKAIHAEKPMAETWGDAQEIGRLADENKVVMTFCHQRRFEAPYAAARELANDGAVGDVLTFEGYCPNMVDWGTHWFDMFFFYNNDEPAQSVLGQIHCEKPANAFGLLMENQGISVVTYENGRKGYLFTGIEGGGCANRIVGTDGAIEIIVRNGPGLRYHSSKTDGWEVPDLTARGVKGDGTTASVLNLIECMKSGEEPVLSVRKALQATELIFATYESSRSRKRIDLPLTTPDNAFLTMLEQGVVGVTE